MIWLLSSRKTFPVRHSSPEPRHVKICLVLNRALHSALNNVLLSVISCALVTETRSLYEFQNSVLSSL